LPPEVYERASSHNPAGYTNSAVALNWTVDQFIADGEPDCNQAIELVSDGMPFGPSEESTRQRRLRPFAWLTPSGLRTSSSPSGTLKLGILI